MMEVIYWLNDAFWSDKFWLPSNYTWDDLKDDNSGQLYPSLYQLYIVIPISMVLLVIRYACERFVFRPIGRYYGLKEKVTRGVSPNKILEKIYKKDKRPNFQQIEEAAEKSSMSTRSVESWFRGRRNMDKYSLLKKFSESGWRFLFYLSAFTCGVWSLWSKPYFWDTKYCWIGYPKQPIDNDTYWYYMIELGFYSSLLISMFTDVKRKDFLEMVIHHFSTMILMVFSWVCNFVRVGTLVLAVHDAVDYWMESAKMAKYTGKNKLCDGLFIIFVIIWFITRLTIFPFRILRTTIYEGLIVSGVRNPFPVYYLLNGLLILLQTLNVIWFCFIMRMLYQILQEGQLQKDARSDSEISDEEIEETKDSESNISPNGDVMKKHFNGFTAAEENGSMIVSHRSKN